MAFRWEDFQEQPGAVPVYQQLAAWLAGAIERGDLPPGMKLPAERDIADMIGHSPETVAKARKLLVDQGLLVSGVGRGTFVATG